MFVCFLLLAIIATSKNTFAENTFAKNTDPKRISWQDLPCLFTANITSSANFTDSTFLVMCGDDDIVVLQTREMIAVADDYQTFSYYCDYIFNDLQQRNFLDGSWSISKCIGETNRFAGLYEKNESKLIQLTLKWRAGFRVVADLVLFDL